MTSTTLEDIEKLFGDRHIDAWKKLIFKITFLNYNTFCVFFVF